MANKDEHELSSDTESVRHKFVDRIFHWTAGVLILILLLSASVLTVLKLHLPHRNHVGSPQKTNSSERFLLA